MCRVCVGVFCSMLSVLYAVGLSEPGLKHQQFRRKRQKITIISAARIVHSLLLFAVVCLDKGTHILRMGGVGTCNAREGRASATRMGPRAATGTGTHVDESVLGESSLLVEEVVDLFEQEPRSSRGQAEVKPRSSRGRVRSGHWARGAGQLARSGGVTHRPLLLAAVGRGLYHRAWRHRPELGRARQAEGALRQRGDAQGIPVYI